MGNDPIVSFSNPAFRDELSNLARKGAQQIIRRAVKAELVDFLEEHAAVFEEGEATRSGVAVAVFKGCVDE